jgi:hypothetical protein
MSNDDDWWQPYAGAAVGAVLGRAAGRKLAGNKKPSKGKKRGNGGGVSRQELKARNYGIGGAVVGAGAGKVVVDSQTDPESVRDSINRALRAKESVQDYASTPNGSENMSNLLYATGGATALAAGRKFLGNASKTIKGISRYSEGKAKSLPRAPSNAQYIPYLAGSAGATAGGMYMDTPRRRK